MPRPATCLPAAFAALLILSGCGPAADRAAIPNVAPVAAERFASVDAVALDLRLGDATVATESRRPRRPGGRRIGGRPVPREGVSGGSSCADADLVPAAENLPALAASTLCLVNGERAAAALPALTHQPLLDRSSVAHSDDMVRNLFFAHDSRDGRTVVDRVKATGYLPEGARWIVGENLAWGTGTLATPREIVRAWMESPGHRENILRAGYREAGLGIVLGNPQAPDGRGATYTMNYGGVERPAQASTLPAVAPTSTAGRSTSRARTSAQRAAAKRAAARRAACRKARRSRSKSKRARARAARCARIARRARR